MESGYIRLYRSIQEHWLWEKQPFSQGQAWIDLLMRAGYKDKTVAFDKQVISLNRGQFVTSERSLMEKWGWNKTRVRTFLKLLESEKMITRKSDHLKTIITICNYAAFQDLGKYDTDQQETSNEPVINQLETSNEPVVNQQETSDEPVRDQTNKRKKENKGKKENNIPPLSPQGENTDIFEGRNFSLRMRERIQEWLDYKTERKEKYKPTGLKKLLSQIENKLAEYREDDVMGLIDECMANNWRGIIWDRLKGQEAPQPKPLTPEEQALQEQLARMRR